MDVIKSLSLRVSFHGQQEIDRIVREVEDDSVVFAGQGKNRNLVHIITGASKAVQQPNATCGVWVSNKKRAPLSTEKVCSKCTRGGTSFTRFNQPRECMSCGKMFADSASRDNTQETCPACYEEAGYENAHQDGYHEADAEGPQEDCPMCKDEARETTPETVAEEMVETKSKLEPSGPTAEHTSGAHQGKIVPDCAGCLSLIENTEATVTEMDLTVESDEQRAARYAKLYAQELITRRAAEIVKRLRRLADEVENDAKHLTADQSEDAMMDAVDWATQIVNEISWAIPNMHAQDLVRDAARLKEAVQDAARKGVK